MDWNRHGEKRPLPQSLGLVASLSLRDGLAQGFAIDQLLDHGEAWERKVAEGLPVPRSEGDGLAVVSFPLGTDDLAIGALSFVVCAGVLGEARPRLEQLAQVCQAIWRIWHMHAIYVQDILRLADLEADLADVKIADRVKALLEMEDLTDSPIAIIARSVATLLAPYQLGNVLKKVIGDLERDTAGYTLVRKAKGVLQHRRNLTEAQAYLHLRQISRQTRRPLADIASELVELGFVSPGSSPRSSRRSRGASHWA